MAYPIYHQTWDGSAPTYADWNIAGSTGFTVGAPSITSSSSALQLAANISNKVLSKTSNEYSADGTLSVYCQMANFAAVLGIMVRCQGLSTTLGDFSAYTFRFFNNSGITNSVWDVIGASGTNSITDVNFCSSSFHYQVTDVILMELRISGSSINCTCYNKTGGSTLTPGWLSSTGNWRPATEDVTAFSITDTLIPSIGRIAILNGNGPNAMIVDDIYWDPPSPVIDYPSLTIEQYHTGQLTAGGFTDPLAGVTWSSDTPSVATVSPTGLVSGVTAGTAIITATGVTKPSFQSATSNVTIIPVSLYRYSPLSFMTTTFSR